MSTVEINLTSLRKGKIETLYLPDLRHRGLVPRRILVKSFDTGETKLSHSLYPFEFKLTSNGNILWTVSATILNRSYGNLRIYDTYTIDNANNLTLLLKPLIDLDTLDLILIYDEHTGYPLFHNEYCILNNEDRTKFLENLVKEVKKVEGCRVDLLLESGVSKVVLSDPYTVGGESYNYQVDRDSELEGVFLLPLAKIANINDLLRSKLEFKCSSGNNVNPNLIGLVIWGFSK